MRGGLRNGGGAKGDRAKARAEWTIVVVNKRPTLPDCCSNPAAPPHFAKQTAVSVQVRVDFDMSQHDCFFGHASPITIVCGANDIAVACTGPNSKPRAINTQISMRQFRLGHENVIPIR